jgi:BirA family biotin operon repressor/biotin-[acetyl-CoA-carboxylase] ligase
MQLRCVNELPSTQDWLIAAAQNGAPESAILAERQTAGRGRGGRAWQAPAGNLNLSILLRPGPVPLQAAAWSLLAGVAVFDAVAGQGARDLQLKWPNDLMLGGAKLAGVLIDSALTTCGLIDWLVIGIGANISAAPDLPDRPTTCLADHGIATAPATLARGIISAIDHWRARGTAATRAAWLARAHPPGTVLRVHHGSEMIEGRFAGLADDGSLMLQNGPAFASGDVFLVGV